MLAWHRSNELSQRLSTILGVGLVSATALAASVTDASGRVYGYRKLHDGLLDQGETSCPNRVARLSGLAGIKAQIGYKRRPGTHSGKPSVVVDNTLARQFDVAAPTSRG